ncbi:MAG: hypothetical protein VW644_12890 [Alphaproteobacteria bacterium]|jgi:hypothetical protein
MYWLKPDIKRDPERRWALPDRIFFGRGACHILAGAFFDAPPLPRFRAEWIVPAQPFAGAHVYVTDGALAFDFHGYARRDRLLAQHWRGWSQRYPGWNAKIRRIDFGLLDTAALNARRMLGPDQYRYDALARARRFLARIDHRAAARDPAG